MHFDGTVTINMSRETVWQFLTDPHAVGQCVPGLKSLDVIVPDEKFQAVAGVGLGSMQIAFTINADWVELDTPKHAIMKAHCTAPGSAADVTCEMALADGGDGATTLDWTAEVMVVGRIASLAARLMSTVAAKLTGQFFKCVKQHIEV
jgi:carbon monoxide dehydrogenase subunit G